MVLWWADPLQDGGVAVSFGYPCREAIPCFGCDQPMNRCVCDVTECGKCKRTIDDFGYCGCKAETAVALTFVEDLGPGRIAA